MIHADDYLPPPDAQSRYRAASDPMDDPDTGEFSERGRNRYAAAQFWSVYGAALACLAIFALVAVWRVM